MNENRTQRDCLYEVIKLFAKVVLVYYLHIMWVYAELSLTYIPYTKYSIVLVLFYNCPVLVIILFAVFVNIFVVILYKFMPFKKKWYKVAYWIFSITFTVALLVAEIGMI